MSSQLIIISGPSGAGKTTLAEHILQTYPKLKRIATVTTRSPRPGERDRIDYTFVSEDTFNELVHNNSFIETNHYNTTWYGTPKSMLSDLKNGVSCVVVPDINGARKIMQLVPDAIAFWVIAPEQELRLRLAHRGETEDAIAHRIQRAREENSEAVQSGLYAHTIINTDLSQAQKEIITLLRQYPDLRE